MDAGIKPGILSDLRGSETIRNILNKMIFITCDISGLKEKAKEYQAAVDFAREEACKLWATGMLPGHFERGAHAKYGYQSRTSKYLKNRKKNGKPDLVFSGRSRERITSPAFRRFTNTQGYTTFYPIIGGDIRYFWMTPSGHPNKPAEMKKVIDAEVAKMNRAFKAILISRLAKEPGANRPIVS